MSRIEPSAFPEKNCYCIELFHSVDAVVQDAVKSTTSLIFEIPVLDTIKILLGFIEPNMKPHSADKHDYIA